MESTAALLRVLIHPPEPFYPFQWESFLFNFFHIFSTTPLDISCPNCAVSFDLIIHNAVKITVTTVANNINFVKHTFSPTEQPNVNNAQVSSWPDSACKQLWAISCRPSLYAHHLYGRQINREGYGIISLNRLFPFWCKTTQVEHYVSID